MIGTSNTRIRMWAVLGALLIPAALVVTTAGTSGSESVRFDTVAATPTPNCPTDSPNDGNENTGYGDLGNENVGNCDVGNGNTMNNANGNANGANSDTPGANAKCPDTVSGGKETSCGTAG